MPNPTAPQAKDLNADNITENAILINSQGDDPRLKYVLERLVTHVHDFARETRLSTKEWMAGLDFLVKVGQISTDVRHEFILLSDVLGLSLLVDAIDHPKPANTTEGTVLGPFHTHEAKIMPAGDDISSDPNGEPCLVICRITNSAGIPIEGVKVDIWETDSLGHYDVYDNKGLLWFKAIRPVSYPIPYDSLDHLIIALYIVPDEYITSDAVFKVKDSLIVEIVPATKAQAKTYRVEEGYLVIEWSFVLVSENKTEVLRDEKAIEAIAKLFPRKKVKLLDHLLVSDPD
ncbi:aromatic compound dioxygenase [Cadophora sp. DSE1049]|nr:aromatic compound dioxygenase [Cadophora sp. DSE1049]